MLALDSGMPFHIHCCKEGKERNANMSIWAGHALDIGSVAMVC